MNTSSRRRVSPAWLLLLGSIGMGLVVHQVWFRPEPPPKKVLLATPVTPVGEVAPQLRGSPGGGGVRQGPLAPGPSQLSTNRVIDAFTGAPVSGATVLALRAAPEPARPLRRNDLLTEAISASEEGEFTLPTEAIDGWLVVRAPSYSEHLAPPGALPASHEPHTIRLERVDSQLTGIVVDESGAPIPNAIIRVAPQGTDSSVLLSAPELPLAPGHLSATTDARGEWTVGVRRDTDWTVMATAEGYAASQGGVAMEGAASAAIWSGSAGAEPVRLILRGHRFVLARLVQEASGDPVLAEATSISLMKPSDRSSKLRLGSRIVVIGGVPVASWTPSLRFHPKRPTQPACYALSVLRERGSGPWPSKVRVLIEVGGFRGAVVELPLLGPGDPPKYSDVPLTWRESSAPRSVRIRVIRANRSEHLAGRQLMVRELGRANGIVLMGRLGQAENEFEFGPLPQGQIRLAVTDGLSDAELDVRAGQDDGYEVRLPPVAGVVLRTYRRDGHRVYGAWAVACPVGTTAEWQMHPWNTWYAPDGHEIPFPLLPGEWTVRAGLPGFVTAEAPIHVETGQVAVVDLTLERSTPHRER